MGIERLLLERELGTTKAGFSKRSLDSIGAWAEADFVLHNCSAQYAHLDRPRSTIASAFCLDGQTIASTHGDHSVKVVNCNTGEMLGTLSGHRRTPWVVRYNPIKTQILASGSLDHSVIVWDSESKQQLVSYNFGKPIASVAFHSNGDLMAVAAGHRVYTWAYNKPGAPAPVAIMKTRKSLRALHFHPLGRPLMLTAEVVERKTSPPANADTAAAAAAGAAVPAGTPNATQGAAAEPAAAAQVGGVAQANGVALPLDPARQAEVDRQTRVLSHISLLLQTSNSVSRSEHETLLRCLLHMRQRVLAPIDDDIPMQAAAGLLPSRSSQGQRGSTPTGTPARRSTDPATGSLATSSLSSWWHNIVAGNTPAASQQQTPSTPGPISPASPTTPDITFRVPPAQPGHAPMQAHEHARPSSPRRGSWLGRGWFGMQRASPQPARSQAGSSEGTEQSAAGAQHVGGHETSRPVTLPMHEIPQTETDALSGQTPEPLNSDPDTSASLRNTIANGGHAHVQSAPGQPVQSSVEWGSTVDLMGLSLDQAWRDGVGHGLKLIPLLPHTLTGALAQATPFEPQWGWEVNPRAAEEAVQTLREQRSMSLNQHFPLPGLPEQPCVVNLVLWPFNVQRPDKALSQPKLQLPRTIMCSEMGCCISRCGRYLACCVAADTPSAACDAWLQRQAAAEDNQPHSSPGGSMGQHGQCSHAHTGSGPHSCKECGSPGQVPAATQFAQCSLDESSPVGGSAGQPQATSTFMPSAAAITPLNRNASVSGGTVYELRVYSLDGPTFGQVLHARPIRAAHCLTSLQFSPTSKHLLVAYGRRHISLCNLLWDSSMAQLAPLHTVVEIYKVEGMDLLRQVAVMSDEVNVAAWHPSPGGGMLYGTKDGKLRLFRHDRREPERGIIPPLAPPSLQHLSPLFAVFMRDVGQLVHG